MPVVFKDVKQRDDGGIVVDQAGNWLVAIREDGTDVLVVGPDSVKAVREAFAKSGGKEARFDEDTFNREKDGKLCWRLKKQGFGGKGFTPRDPLPELAGIAHHQAVRLVLGDGPINLADWDTYRAEIKRIALAIAGDRLEIVATLKDAPTRAMPVRTEGTADTPPTPSVSTPSPMSPSPERVQSAGVVEAFLATAVNRGIDRSMAMARAARLFKKNFAVLTDAEIQEAEKTVLARGAISSPGAR